MSVDSTSSVVGAGIIGAGAGAFAGKKVLDAKITKKFSEGFLKSKNIDEYVASRIEANMENVHKLKHSKWAKTFSEIAQKAREDYPKLVERLESLKSCKSCKLKYIGGGAAIGLAVGAGVIALVKHFSNKNKA